MAMSLPCVHKVLAPNLGADNLSTCEFLLRPLEPSLELQFVYPELCSWQGGSCSVDSLSTCG